MKISGFLSSIILMVMVNGAFAQSENEEVNDTLAIMETAMNYGDGFLSGSGERVEKALSPDLVKLAPAKLPNTDKTILIQSTVSGLVGMARARLGYVDESKRNIKVDIILINGDIACARLTSSQFNDYLEMTKTNGEWKIVNVLWTFGPESPNRQQVPVLDEEEQKPLIEQMAKDYIEGIYTGDTERVGKALHLRFSQATLALMPESEIALISRDGYDLVVEAAGAKMALQDQEKWNFQVKVLDYMDGLALVELTAPGSVSYIQAAFMDGDWKMVNMLRKRA